ncbi:MAG: class I SAM-dependent methyltransferase [Candidatus Marinimicrobia bacterium]|jgi:SAM-dependent methyltransferase|nr:class I SAM-dependent methyltransferase [Candidatus Neomarinimicrobiota bacterium]MBT6673387.1 class I SAM-dependent methyltransferase [Lentimicrobiaceae bacterium]
MLKQRRKCFICGNSHGELLFNDYWKVSGCDQVEVGIRICLDCGMVLQDPIVPDSIMSKWYSQIGNYANPSRNGKPSIAKVAAVDHQIEHLKKYVSKPGNAFQVGCSDGYTLSRFKEEGWQVGGVDPSPIAAEVSNVLYGIKPTVGFFENYTPKTGEKYDLIILTHVLEHLYDPVLSLKKCLELLAPEGELLIEVPALTHPENWSISFFTFEHVNYFSQISMENSLRKSGFSIQGEWNVHLERKDYPVMTCIAKKDTTKKVSSIISDYKKAKNSCEYFLKNVNAMWVNIDKHLSREFKKITHIVIWAAGIHTSQLLANTSIESNIVIDYLVDMDPQKRDFKLGEYDIRDPDSINFNDPTLGIVISSFEAEDEIYKTIISKVNLKANVIRLHKQE